MSEIDDQKSVAYYQTLLAAWIENKIDHDRTILTLSTASIGFHVTLLATIKTDSFGVHLFQGLAIVAFIVAVSVALTMYSANAEILTTELKKSLQRMDADSPPPDFKDLDKLESWAFGAGVVFSVLYGLAFVVTTGV